MIPRTSEDVKWDQGRTARTPNVASQCATHASPARWPEENKTELVTASGQSGSRVAHKLSWTSRDPRNAAACWDRFRVAFSNFLLLLVERWISPSAAVRLSICN